jgi:uncharacterized phage-associated protein
MTLDDCADYIITKICEGGSPPSVLKLQKLLYYSQAWHLAFYARPLFPGKFEAWVHGPVNRALYRRFVGRSMYAAVTDVDVRPDFQIERIADSEGRHVDDVLEAYASMSGTQLEVLTHSEAPWISARGGLPMNARCVNEIEEEEMKEFYKARVG